MKRGPTHYHVWSSGARVNDDAFGILIKAELFRPSFTAK